MIWLDSEGWTILLSEIGGVRKGKGFWSQFKRSVHGTFHAVSPKYLQTYLDEFSFRYNHRKSSQSLPVLMFSRVGTLLPKDEKIAS